MNIFSKRFKVGLIGAAFVGTFCWTFSHPVMTQVASYHAFIDTRSFAGIPNAQNVLSNIFFLLSGFLGLSVLSTREVKTKKSWWWFFLSIMLVAPGSAYYHLDPNNATLVWDRLPMSMGFMALYIVLLAEHITFKTEKFLYPAIITGLISVGVWVITADLRLYYWVQFSTFVTVPLILFLFPSSYTKKYWYFITLLFYGASKWVEMKDSEIYFFTNQVMSGHTLKHILAAAGLAGLCWMVKTRTEALQAVSGGSISNSTPTFQ